MRETPLTDRQKAGKGLHGGYAPCVGGREATAESNQGSRTKRKGGVAMKRNAMRAIVKVFIVGTLGVAALLGSPAVTLALPKFVVGKTYCICYCYSEQAKDGRDIGWEKDKACSLSDGKQCRLTSGGKTWSGTLASCGECTGYSSTGCGSAARAYRATDHLELTIAPEAAPPSTTIPPRGPRPAPGGILTK